MHIIRDNRNDAEIQKADKEPLFLWNFLKHYGEEDQRHHAGVLGGAERSPSAK